MKGGFANLDGMLNKLPKLPGMPGKGKKGGSKPLVGGGKITKVAVEKGDDGKYTATLLPDDAPAAPVDSENGENAEKNNNAASVEKDDEDVPVEENANGTLGGKGGKRRKRKTAAKKSKKSKKGGTRKAHKPHRK